MTIETKTKYGSISISNEAIADVVSDAVLSCCGVVGIAKRNSLREAIIEIAKKGNFSQGIFSKNYLLSRPPSRSHSSTAPGVTSGTSRYWWASGT